MQAMLPAVAVLFDTTLQYLAQYNVIAIIVPSENYRQVATISTTRLVALKLLICIGGASTREYESPQISSSLSRRRTCTIQLISANICNNCFNSTSSIKQSWSSPARAQTCLDARLNAEYASSMRSSACCTSTPAIRVSGTSETKLVRKSREHARESPICCHVDYEDVRGPRIVKTRRRVRRGGRTKRLETRSGRV
jgi:hypothetical protein